MVQSDSNYSTTVNGVTYNLTRVNELIGIAPNDVVEGIFLSMNDGTKYLGGVQIIGYNTYPNLMPTSSSATFTGNAVFVIRLEGGLDGFGDGATTLQADFGAGTIQGAMTLGDAGASNSDFVVPNATVTLSATPIAGNSFSGAPNVAITSVTTDPVTIDATGLNGQFYGPGVEAVGGEFFATGTNGALDMIIEGAFVAAQ